MESAELKKKRVRHSYPRHELYHRFIHDSTFVYNDRSNPCWAAYNWLFAGKCYSRIYANTEDINEFTSAFAHKVPALIAVINRNKKEILITTKYNTHYFDIKRSVPDDWKIFLTDKDIPFLNIFDDKETLYKLVATYYVEDYTRYCLSKYYDILNNDKIILHNDVAWLYSDNNYYYKRLIDFINNYKLGKYDWFKTSLNTNLSVGDPRDWRNVHNYAVPSLKSIRSNTVFNKKEIELLSQQYFYSKYCYGKGISLAFVKSHWDKPCTSEEALKVLKSKIRILTLDHIKDCNTWNEAIKEASILEDSANKSIINDNIKKSEENYQRAIKEAKALVSENYNVDDWRAFKSIDKLPNKRISYQCYIAPRGRSNNGEWRTVYLYGDYYTPFENTQLRLSRDKDKIETSRHAVVPYNSGIILWNLFIRCINSHPNQTYFDFTHIRINVGIYNLRFIRYCTKCNDKAFFLHDNDNLIKDWVIQVGCHRLWLSDILDFIHYYKLENDFSTNNIIFPNTNINETNQ